MRAFAAYDNISDAMAGSWAVEVELKSTG